MCMCVCVSLDFRDLHPFKNFKEYPSRMVTDFIDRVRHLCTLRSLLFKVCIYQRAELCVCVQMRLLPVEGGVREGFIFHFLHHLKLKALALSKYVDAEP